jgi:hypothetical protein
MDRCIVLTARRYDFQDEKTGRRIEGVTLTYLTGEAEEQADYRGQAVMQIPAPADIWHQLPTIPGVYAIDFRQRPGLKGRPTLQAVGAEFLADADFSVFDGFTSRDREVAARELRS